ncbi:MAG: alpha-L-arabinofuranosidase [Bacteroidaceae bacterium]|nr:alpha-L-arabinofuranosidase [Bacteroidaceae bacterium]
MRKLSALVLGLSFFASMDAQIQFDVNTNKIGAGIESTMYGIFFEDINYAADGGLYGELVKNRSFEFPDRYMGWNVFGNIQLKDDGPFDRCPHYVRLGYSGHSDKFTGLENEGYFGIGYEKGAEYRFSFWARVPEGGTGRFRVMFCDPKTMGERQQFMEHEIIVISKEWKKHTVVLKSPQTVDKGSLRIMLGGNSSVVDLEHISLFPVDTWKGHENGMRKDLAQALADLKPGVFRFPGGCIVEGTDLATRYQWKNSVGPVENRPLNENRWHYTFDYRFFPDYFQSYGLGFYEYFLLSEEIGAEPLPVISVGLSCQFQNREEKFHQPLDELQPYIDDVLDLIEFANGDPKTSKWAKIRSEMGHHAPFNLKYVAIGNEQWGQTYIDHLKPFVDQVRKKYPHIQIIGTSGPNSEGKDFEFLWPEMRKIGADLVDEHFYRPESWFLSSGPRYDNYPRRGSKVFAGEYACHGKGKKWNHFEAALLEAAFMTGVERNADVVKMATYAPLFAHIDGWQWRPDMIWFDNLRNFRSCSYYIQQLYSLTKGTNVVPLTWNGKPVEGLEDQQGLFASANFDKNANCYYIKVVNTSDQPKDISFNMKGMRGDRMATLTTFHSDDMDAENTLDKPTAILPVEHNIEISTPDFGITIKPKTFAIFKIDK